MYYQNLDASSKSVKIESAPLLRIRAYRRLYYGEGWRLIPLPYLSIRPDIVLESTAVTAPPIPTKVLQQLNAHSDNQYLMPPWRTSGMSKPANWSKYPGN